MNQSPIQFESIKAGLRQTKDGYMLTLSVHPDDAPEDLMRDFVGSRYMVVMVRINDDEQPMDRAAEFPGDHAVKMAAVLCKDPNFWEWLHTNEMLFEKNEQACVDWLKSFLNIGSRKDLKTNEDARELFNQIMEKYHKCQQD